MGSDKSHQSMEDKLRGLMPVALSNEAQVDLENMIDELAGVTSDSVIPYSEEPFSQSLETEAKDMQKAKQISFQKKYIWQSAAVITLCVSPLVINLKRDVDSSPIVSQEDDTELVILSSTNRLESSESDGLIYPEDGGAPHYRYRYQIMNEEEVRDSETGLVVTLSQPSQEVHMIPVTLF